MYITLQTINVLLKMSELKGKPAAEFLGENVMSDFTLNLLQETIYIIFTIS
jgi:hypothetical protein